MSGYVTTDSPSADLITAVSKVIKGGKYLSPALAERIIGYLAPGCTTLSETISWTRLAWHVG